MNRNQRLAVKLSYRQVLRVQRLGEQLRPGEELSLEEVSRRLLLELLLWAESERRLVWREL